MPRGRLARIGLGVILLLLVTGCGIARDYAMPLFSRSEVLPAPPPAFRTPRSPLATRAPLEPQPWPTAMPTAGPPPTVSPPPPKPSPTPLPTATPFVPLGELRRTPAPSTSVLGHGLRLPDGFDVDVYAKELQSVTYMAYSPGGVLYASLTGRGAVVALPDTTGDGRADSMTVFAQGLAHPSGLAFHEDHLYVAEAHRVVRFRLDADDLRAAGKPEVVVPDLPVGGGHINHAIGFGPEGKLYVAVGSSCNACREIDFRRATIMRYEPDGSREDIYAHGLRAVEGLCWYPGSNQLLATNCSRRRMGEDLPPDTLELVYYGMNFGWPFCHAGDIPDPELGWPEACDGVARPFQQFPAHSTPRGLCVYTGGQFPPEYYGDIFVAAYGSWERRIPVGYKIVRLDVEGGRVVGTDDFASGWLVNEQPWGRPVDVIQAPDGSLLVSDEWAGAIYRIYYEG